MARNVAFRVVIRIAVAAVVFLSACPTRAAISASATVTLQSVNGASPTPYHYTVSLQNTGTTNIGTYWFGWIPNYDFMPHQAVNVQSPANWVGAGLNDSIYGFYSLEWTTTTAPLAPGQTLGGFSFDSVDAPAALTAPSVYFGSTYPNNTSYVYIGASQGDPGALFASTVVAPEPAGLTALAPAVLLLLRSRRGHRGRTLVKRPSAP